MEAAVLSSLAVFQREALSHRLISTLIHYKHFNEIIVLSLFFIINKKNIFNVKIKSLKIFNCVKFHLNQLKVSFL